MHLNISHWNSYEDPEFLVSEEYHMGKLVNYLISKPVPKVTKGDLSNTAIKTKKTKKSST